MERKRGNKRRSLEGGGEGEAKRAPRVSPFSSPWRARTHTHTHTHVSSLLFSPPLARQVSSSPLAVGGAGYHYVYNLELKCRIMTQLGSLYNLCP